MAEKPKIKYTPDELITLAASPNIAEFIDDEELEQIGEDVVGDYEDDFGRMSDKIAQWDEIIKLTKQVQEEKNFPWPGASNVNLPVITSACLRFGARIYPEIVQSGKIARVKTEGIDPEGAIEDRAQRVERHLNWQLSEDICNWECDMDTLLSLVAMYGCYYKKIYYSSLKKEPVVEIYNPKEIITSPECVPLSEKKRISQEIKLNSNRIIERIRNGLFLNVDIPYGENDDEDDTDENIEEFIEQHCWLDLDEDGYKEPYVVTAHKESKQVFRIIARFTEDDVETKVIEGVDIISRIEAFTHYVKYLLLPAFDDSDTGLGFGELLVPLSNQINSTVNQLTDAGTLANVRGGFLGRGIRMDGGPFRVSMGEWIPVETRGGSLADNIYPLPAGEPSQTLMALLQMMMDTADALAANVEVQPGEIPMNSPATTTLAVIEEGLKVYSSIHKRIYASLKQEIRKIYKLNKLYGDPEEYATFQNIPDVDMHADYDFEDLDITPATSPQVSTDMQRMVRAQGLVQLMAQPGVMEAGLNPRAVVENYLEATHQPNVDELLPPPPPVQEGPSLEEQMLQMQAQLEQQKIEVDRYKAETDRMYKETSGIKNIADAEAAEAGVQLEQYQQGVQNIKDIISLEQNQEQLNQQRAQAAQQQTPTNEQARTQ